MQRINKTVIITLWILGIGMSFVGSSKTIAAPEIKDSFSHILPMRNRAKVTDQILKERIETILPSLMRKNKIDMWLLISREYNEDPVLKTMLPATWMSARRRTILVIYDPGNELPLETLAVARYDVGNIFRKAWDKNIEPDQWQRLVEIIVERNPQKIAVNESMEFGLADGINATDLNILNTKLPEKLSKRIVSAESLAIGWLEARSNIERTLYPHIVGIAHQLIAKAFSSEVITPGITTTDDVVWWLREKVAALKLTVWFHPTVSIQRSDKKIFDHVSAFSEGNAGQVILPGDLLHVDFGITYLGLNTDTQQHAYVLNKCELDAPKELLDALIAANRLQDILTSGFAIGKTGNQLLKETLDKAIKEGIKPSIYSHPIGFHGHGAGPAIGMWDNQQGVPKGEKRLNTNTAYSIELNTESNIKSWGKSIRIMLEEDAMFTNEGLNYLHGRQKKFLLVGKSKFKNSSLSIDCDSPS